MGPIPPGWGLGVGLTTSFRTKHQKCGLVPKFGESPLWRRRPHWAIVPMNNNNKKKKKFVMFWKNLINNKSYDGKLKIFTKIILRIRRVMQEGTSRIYSSILK